MARGTDYQDIERRDHFANDRRELENGAHLHRANAILIRGYPVDEMMVRLSLADGRVPFLMGELPPRRSAYAERRPRVRRRITGHPPSTSPRGMWGGGGTTTGAADGKTRWQAGILAFVSTSWAATSSRACDISTVD